MYKPNYKKGDRVKLLSTLKELDNTVPEMEQYAGKIVTIFNVNRNPDRYGCYRISEDGRRWAWGDNMILQKILTELNYEIY